MIKIEGLTIFLKTFHLKNVQIEVEEKEFHFLLGPTGSGKTLILESIIGLHKPKKGKIWIGEREIQDLPPEQREISYVPQDLALFPHLKVKDNILYGIKARNLDMKVYEEYVQTLIEVMKLEHLLERYPTHLSGGEKKRVALLRALAPKPKLLLLDEPLSGLDPSIKVEIQQLLKTLCTSFHPTVLCVTHDFGDAYFLGDRMTIFIEGKVRQVGKREDVFLKPESKKVAQFMGLKNIYHPRVLRKDDSSKQIILRLNGFRLALPPSFYSDRMEEGKEVELFIRPEEVMIIREGKPIKDSLRRNIFDGKIIDITDERKDHRVNLQTAEGKIPLEISIPNYAFRNLNLSIGKNVKVALRDESLWIMPPDPDQNSV